MNRFLLQVWSLAVRDLRHFVRQRSRVIGAIGQPFVLWVFLDAGFRHTLGGGERYGAYLYPGVIMLIALFSAIFSTISVIEDRKSGFLQGVLVAPVSAGALVAGKLVAGTVLALVQSLLFLILLPFSGMSVTPAGVLLGLVALVPACLTLTGAGFLMAWRMRSTQGFHAIMNLVLVPAWMLSGSFFPAEGAARWLQWIIALNPLTSITTVFREAFLTGSAAGAVGGGPSLPLALAVSLLALLVTVTLSITTVRVRA